MKAIYGVEAARESAEVPTIPPVGGRPAIDGVMVGWLLWESAVAGERRAAVRASLVISIAYDGEVAAMKVGGIARRGGCGGFGNVESGVRRRRAQEAGPSLCYFDIYSRKAKRWKWCGSNFSDWSSMVT